MLSINEWKKNIQIMKIDFNSVLSSFLFPISFMLISITNLFCHFAWHTLFWPLCLISDGQIVFNGWYVSKCMNEWEKMGFPHHWSSSETLILWLFYKIQGFRCFSSNIKGVCSRFQKSSASFSTQHSSHQVLQMISNSYEILNDKKTLSLLIIFQRIIICL